MHLMKRYLVMCVWVQGCVCVFWDKFILDICIDRLDSRSPSTTLPYRYLHCWYCLRSLELVKIYVLKTDLLTLWTEIMKIHDSGSGLYQLTFCIMTLCSLRWCGSHVFQLEPHHSHSRGDHRTWKAAARTWNIIWVNS